MAQIRKSVQLHKIEEEEDGNQNSLMRNIQDLQDLSSVRELDLSNCQLSETPYLLTLTNLKRLNLSQNKIKLLNCGLLPRSTKIIDASSNIIKYVSQEHMLLNRVSCSPVRTLTTSGPLISHRT